MSAPGTGRSADDPRTALRALCRDAAARAAGPELRAELQRIGDLLDRPLQLAVAGATSAGKSTLINAILARPIAPVDARECTRIVARYEYGPDDGLVLVERHDGTVLRRRLVDDRMPTDLGSDPSDVRRLVVHLDQPWLRHVTVIDTPGMNTVSTRNEGLTRELLFGGTAAGDAQALIYVLRHVQTFDAAALTEFESLSGAAGMTAVHTAAVLGQIDRADGDVWATARRRTRTASESLRDLVLDVAPVAGLVAEAGRARLLGRGEVAVLRHLAGLDEWEVEDLLMNLAEFAAGDGQALPAGDCESLVNSLHKFGIQEAVEYLRERPDATTDALHERLVERSGYGVPGATSDPTAPTTVAAVVDRFVRHAGLLTAYDAMSRLRRLGRVSVYPDDAGLVRELRAAVDEHRPLAASLGALRVLSASAAVSRGQLRLSDDMTAELMRLARSDDVVAGLGLESGTPADRVLDEVRRAATRWRGVTTTVGTTTVGGRRSRDVTTMLEELVDRLDRQAPRDMSTPADLPPLPPLPELPPTDRLRALAGSPLVPEADRRTVLLLAEAKDLPEVLGLDDSAPPDRLRAAAAEGAGRFRALLHRPLPRRERAAAQGVCDLFETVATTAPKETAR